MSLEVEGGEEGGEEGGMLPELVQGRVGQKEGKPTSLMQGILR